MYCNHVIEQELLSEILCRHLLTGWHIVSVGVNKVSLHWVQRHRRTLEPFHNISIYLSLCCQKSPWQREPLFECELPRRTSLLCVCVKQLSDISAFFLAVKPLCWPSEGWPLIFSPLLEMYCWTREQNWRCMQVKMTHRSLLKFKYTRRGRKKHQQEPTIINLIEDTILTWILYWLKIYDFVQCVPIILSTTFRIALMEQCRLPCLMD